MSMEFTPLSIDGVISIRTGSHADERGTFGEVFRLSEYEEAGVHCNFKQANISVSRKGVLRGLHFQKSPHAQAKLLSVLRGEIWDVVVDIRRESSTFGKWISQTMAPTMQLWIPEGFAHGFLSLEDDTCVLYHTGAEYRPESEGGIRFDDTDLGIPWPGRDFIVSSKDRGWPCYREVADRLRTGLRL